jgi:hypothetical protein
MTEIRHAEKQMYSDAMMNCVHTLTLLLGCTLIKKQIIKLLTAHPKRGQCICAWINFQNRAMWAFDSIDGGSRNFSIIATTSS